MRHFQRRGRNLTSSPSGEYYPLNGGAGTYKTKCPSTGHLLLAERAGFEPANLCGLHAFQACALSQTTRPLHQSSDGIIPEIYFMSLRGHHPRNNMLVMSVIQRALIDPVDDQLHLRRRELGSAFRHLLRYHHFDKHTVVSIAGNDHSPAFRTCHCVCMSPQ